MKKIAFAGTDGRTLLCALVTATAKSDIHQQEFKGVVIRGTPSMPAICEIMNWPVEFVTTDSNSVEDYTAAIITALKEKTIDYVIPMPEALLFEGLVVSQIRCLHRRR
jgi:phosphoribosylamine--glycine ligase